MQAIWFKLIGGVTSPQSDCLRCDPSSVTIAEFKKLVRAENTVKLSFCDASDLIIKTTEGGDEFICGPDWTLTSFTVTVTNSDGMNRTVVVGSSAQHPFFVVVPAPAAAVTAEIPEIDIIRVFRALPPCPTDLRGALQTPLPPDFRIPVTMAKWSTSYPDTFVLRRCIYGVSIDAFLDHFLVSYTSEAAVTGLTNLWLTAARQLTNATVYLDQHDDSSQWRTRPDATLMRSGALVLKVEAKTDVSQLDVAKKELASKLHRRAWDLFPVNRHSFCGVAVCNSAAEMFEVRWNDQNREFESVRIGERYDLSFGQTRVAFVVDLFKVFRWIATVTGPQKEFHLVPNVRTKTRNGHFVTLRSSGILKEFRGRVTEVTLERLKAVYSRRLANVEWGTVNVMQRYATITRIGQPLRHSIARGLVTSERAIAAIRDALDQLHSIGFAHCDVCVDNVLVDDEGTVFLDDLEYVTPLQDPIPHEQPTRLPHGCTIVPATAEELDELQFETFVMDLQGL